MIGESRRAWSSMSCPRFSGCRAEFTARAEAAIDARGRFLVALPGGIRGDDLFSRARRVTRRLGARGRVLDRRARRSAGPSRFQLRRSRRAAAATRRRAGRRACIACSGELADLDDGGASRVGRVERRSPAIRRISISPSPASAKTATSRRSLAGSAALEGGSGPVVAIDERPNLRPDALP